MVVSLYLYPRNIDLTRPAQPTAEDALLDGTRHHPFELHRDVLHTCLALILDTFERRPALLNRSKYMPSDRLRRHAGENARGCCVGTCLTEPKGCRWS